MHVEAIAPNEVNFSSMESRITRTLTPPETSKDIQQRPTKEPSSCTDSDCQEQVVALLQAIDLLSQLASSSNDSSSASHRLDALEQQWKLEDTQIPPLRQEIERLQSQCHTLQQEDERHTEEVQSLHDKLELRHNRIQELERAVHKLYRKNERLSRKLEQRKKERKSIVKHVKNYVEHAKKSDREEVAHQLYCHERLLQQSRSPSERDASDIEALLVEDEVSVSSVSTTSSRITDDAVATVRYESSHHVNQQDEASVQSQEYNLTFPQGSKIGLQFHKVELTNGLLNDAIQEPPSFRNFQFGAKPHHDHVYLVCGHNGFDRDLNTLPTLGARLVKVNGESVINLSLDKIKEATKCTEKDFFSLTFCNDPLTPKQQDILNHAVEATKRQYDENGDATTAKIKQHKPHPIIIELHDELETTTSRLGALFLNNSRGRMDSEAELDSSTRDSQMDEASGNSFSSFLNSARSRLDSDPDIVEDASSSHPMGSRLGSFLHGSRSRNNSDPEVSSTKEQQAEESHAALPETPAKSISSFFQGARSRINSEPNLDFPPSDDASPETPAKLIGSFFHQHGPARGRTLSDNNVTPSPKQDHGLSFEHVDSADAAAHVKEEQNEPSAAPSLESPTLPQDTPPTQKLKKSMKNMGSHFKSLF